MAQGDEIPDSNHITRLVPFSKIDDLEEGERVNAQAFLLRENEEYLSVNWLEYDGEDDRETCLNKLRANAESNEYLTVRPSSRFPIINIGAMKLNVRKKTPDNRSLRVIHEPDSSPDPSHSGIYGYDHTDLEIAEYIVETIEEIPYVRVPR